MLCPLCAHKENLPGDDECRWCQFSLTSLDRPVPVDRVDRSLMLDPVEVLHPRQPVTILHTDRLGLAMQLMLRHRVGALLVVDREGDLLGILTERDFLTKVAGRSEASEFPIQSLMTPRPETIQLTDILATALGKMTAGRYRHLPVVQGEKPIGMISVRDILRHLMELC